MKRENDLLNKMTGKLKWHIYVIFDKKTEEKQGTLRANVR